MELTMQVQSCVYFLVFLKPTLKRCDRNRYPYNKYQGKLRSSGTGKERIFSTSVSNALIPARGRGSYTEALCTTHSVGGLLERWRGSYTEALCTTVQRLRTGRCIVRLLEHHYPECITCDVTLCILSLLCRQCRCFIECYQSHIPNLFMMASETPRVYDMFGCKFTPGIEKCCYSFRKTRSSQIYGFKSAGDQMVSTSTQLECADGVL